MPDKPRMLFAAARQFDVDLPSSYMVGDRWRDVLVLLGEILCFRENDTQRMDSLLNALAPAPLSSGTARVR